MTHVGPFDPRSVCNLMLDEADAFDAPISNLALQKLLYFAHGLFLIEQKRPLVSGYFEAWQYGPVHPAAYSAFKTAGKASIEFRASGTDPLTGEKRSIAPPNDKAVLVLIRRIMLTYGNMTPGRLVDISHAKHAPWRVIVEKGQSGVSFGLRIPDELIVERFKHHKVSVDAQPNVGEPGDDAPFNS